MKKLLLFLVIVFPFLLQAQAITNSKAVIIGKNYLKQQRLNTKGHLVESTLQLVEKETAVINGEEKPLYYIFSSVSEKQTANPKNIKAAKEAEVNEGFIIVSGNEALEPILAYSNNSLIHENPEERSPEFNYWMQQYEQQISDAYKKNIKATDELKSKWQKLESGETLTSTHKASSQAVDPLLTTRWDQGNPYNSSCPNSFFGGRAVTGCVATAMAQVMKYHNHPPQGEGYHSYNSDQYGTLSADYGATSYGWGSMQNQPSSSSPSVATLMYHCGVSVNMNYSPQSSGAYVIEGDAQNCSEKAFKEYFGYNTSTVKGVRRQSYSNSQWTNLIRTELESNQPVLYAGFGNGGGHAFVCDGVDNSDLFHFNWGWGGYEDGYFQLNALSPNLGGTGAGNGGYNSGQQAVVGVKPAYGGNNGGGEPTPPDSDDDAFYGLGLYSGLNISQSPLDFNQPFELTTQIGNYGNSTVSGTIAAILNDAAGNQIAIIEPKSLSLPSNNFDNFSFSTAGLTAVPAQYSLGVYFKSGNTDWRLIDGKDFNNPGGIEIVGTENNLKVYSQFTIDPNPVAKGQPFSVSVDVGNFGNSGFNGNVSMDLYTLDGDYISELDIIETSLNSQTFNTFNFQSEGLNSVEAGTYLLVIWNQPNGGDWEIVGSYEDNKNPIYINVAEQGLQADGYESNNSSANAFAAAPNFSGNVGTFATQNANIHTGDDQDYFSINLPAGESYTVKAEVKDSYNASGTYTNDMLFAYKLEGGEWSETYDSSMPNLNMPNGGKIYFVAASYFVGKTGTYQLKVEVNGEAYTSLIDLTSENIKLYPNPSNGVVTLEDLPNNASRLNVYNLEGKLIGNHAVNSAGGNYSFDLPNNTAGVYIIEIADKAGNTLARKRVLLQL